MGWQDRDYARVDSPRAGYYRARTRFGATRSIVKTLIAINVGVFVVAMFSDQLKVAIYSFGVMQVRAVWGGQVWRLLTSTYLHDPSSFYHILFNMLGLYFLGPPLEQRWGARKFLAVYTIAGVLGNVALMILANLHDPLNPRMRWLDPSVPAMGASGSILGLLGACAVLFPRAEVLVYFLFPVKIRTAAIVYGLYYVWNVWNKGTNFGGDACHIVGLLFGAWWAWQGDRWWHGGSPFRRGQGGGVAGRVSWQPVKSSSVGPVDADTVDRILKKVYEGGIHSLTPDERQVLIETTERQRQSEARSDYGSS